MRKLNKKGNITLFIVFAIVSVVIVVLTGVFAPFGILLNTELMVAGEEIYLEANESIQRIQNATIRNNVMSVINEGFAQGQNNIEINNAFFQYSWVWLIGLTALIMFLLTRSLVEVQARGGGLT